MTQPITAVYVREEGDYTVTVTGDGQEFADRAPGIIAARDRADQLIEKIAPKTGDDEDPTVVHLLDGSALEFTSAYMTARLSRAETAEQDESGDTAGAEDVGEADAAAGTGAADTAATDVSTAEAGTADVAEADVAEAGTADVETADVEASGAEDDSTESDTAEADAEIATDDTSADSDTEDAAQAASESVDSTNEDDGAAAQTAPGSGVPRKELTKSPDAAETTAGDDESGDKPYAAATNTAAAS
ncbi:hypothetical protein GCM10009676_25750 [Prauserella halophila]|uniref:Uncharacterized protein n=1 Tax=Prauserella halophila TaxID=185641 RepID=A0ABP4GVA2_9PSEU|nr:hypothetical protein [Prauserella halophila]MCP2234950.1 hypothetical protein [Prauserella halophila]